MVALVFAFPSYSQIDVTITSPNQPTLTPVPAEACASGYPSQAYYYEYIVVVGSDSKNLSHWSLETDNSCGLFGEKIPYFCFKLDDSEIDTSNIEGKYGEQFRGGEKFIGL